MERGNWISTSPAFIFFSQAIFERGVKDLFFFYVNLQNSSGAYNLEVSLTVTNTKFSFFSIRKQNNQQKDNLPV